MNTFLYIEGLLQETGKLELSRVFETKEVPLATSHFAGHDKVDLFLTDDQGYSLHSEKLPVVFNHGCNTDSKMIATAPIQTAIPLFPGTTKLVAHYEGKEIFSAPVGKLRPKLSDLKVSVSGHKAMLSFTTEAAEDGIQIFARLSDKRLLRPSYKIQDKGVLVDLNSLSGQGEVSLIVEATHQFRTMRSESDPIPTPPSTALGLIIEPADQSTWPFGKRGSLIASVFDGNGRKLDWDHSGLFWRINGQDYEDKRQTACWAPKKEGDYQIQLLKKNEQGQEEVLGESKVEVLPPTEAQKEYISLMKAMKMA